MVIGEIFGAPLMFSVDLYGYSLGLYFPCSLYLLPDFFCLKLIVYGNISSCVAR